MQLPREVIENIHILSENRVGETLRLNDPKGARMNDNGRVNKNIGEFDGLLVFPPQTGLFAGLPVDDPHGHIAMFAKVA